MANSTSDLLIVGNGITGLTAAKYAAQMALATASIEALLFGGLVININELDGELDVECTSGISLATSLMTELAGLGITNFNETVTGIEHQGEVLSVRTNGDQHCARAIIIASGARIKRLGIPGESQLEHCGVSQCADCDGPMYRDKDVVVIGGGDSALQEALVLSNHCKCVYLINRGRKFRARQHFVDAVKGRKNIKVEWNTIAMEVIGSQMVEGVRVRNAISDEIGIIPCNGFFAYVGLEPNSSFVPPQVKRDTNGYLITDNSLHTAMAGVFAAGAVRSGYGGLLRDAVADARTAASAAAGWISRH